MDDFWANAIQVYQGYKLVNIPSGLGGVFPAAIVEEKDGEVKKLCLHPDFFTGQIQTVNADHLTPFNYELTSAMKRLIEIKKSVG